MKATVRSLLFLAIWLPLFSSEAAACFCAGGGAPCEDYGKASAVFAGIVIGFSTADLTEGNRQFSRRIVKLNAELSFKGIEGSQVEVVTGWGESDCGFPFELGKRYLVYASQDTDKRLYAGTCSRTRLLSDAEDDLAYIRGLATAARGATIFGVVNWRTETKAGHNLQPVTGVRINIESGANSNEVSTDSKGEYRVAGLTPGKYKITINPPPGLTLYNPVRETTVGDRACAELDFWLESNTSLTGRVFDEQNQSIPDVLVELKPKDPHGSQQYVRTDKDGRYEIKMVKPGSYWLGVRIVGSAGSTYVPYPRVYYPGVSEWPQAKVIKIAEGEVLNDIDLPLPPRLIETKLEGVVLWPDGKPVKGATVWLKDIEYHNFDMPYQVQTDDQGRFSFKVFEGMKYNLNAYVASGTQGVQNRSDNVEVRALGKTEVVRLILSR